MNDKLKRILAFLLDWNISFLPTAILFSCFLSPTIQQGQAGPLTVGLGILLPLLVFAAIVLRDVLGRGRSLGKRIMKLYILDKTTLQRPRTSQLILRNVFVPLYLIDGILLLSTGRSLGDMAAETVVLSDIATAGQPSALSKKTALRVVIVVICIVVIFVAAILFLTLSLLESRKDTPQYTLAYDYLTSSEAFTQLEAGPDQIRLNRYASSYSAVPDQEGFTQTMTFGFRAAGRSFTVTCHELEGRWQVCRDCTDFQ